MRRLLVNRQWAEPSCKLHGDGSRICSAFKIRCRKNLDVKGILRCILVRLQLWTLLGKKSVLGSSLRKCQGRRMLLNAALTRCENCLAIGCCET